MGDLRIGSVYPPTLYHGTSNISKVMCGNEQIWPNESYGHIGIKAHFIIKGQNYSDDIYVSKDFTTIVAPKALYIERVGDEYILYYERMSNGTFDRYHEYRRTDGLRAYQGIYNGVVCYTVRIWEGYVINMMEKNWYDDELWVYYGDNTREILKLIINVSDGSSKQGVVATFNALNNTVLFNNPNITANRLEPYDQYDDGWEINGLAFSPYRKNSGQIHLMDTWVYPRMDIPLGPELKFNISDSSYEFYGPSDYPYVMMVDISYDNMTVYDRHISIVDYEGFSGVREPELIKTVLFDDMVSYGDIVKSEDGRRITSRYNADGDLVITYRYNTTNAKLLDGPPNVRNVPGLYSVEKYRPGADQDNWYAYMQSWYDTITIYKRFFTERYVQQEELEYSYTCDTNKNIYIYMDETYIVKNNEDIRYNGYNGYMELGGGVNFHAVYPHSGFKVERIMIDGKYFARLTTYSDDWHISHIEPAPGRRFPECLSEQHDDRHLDFDLSKITDFSATLSVKIIAYKEYWE